MRLLLLLLACAVLPAQAAINPAEFTRNVPDQMRVRETARIVELIQVGDSTLRRVTLVGEVVAQKNASSPRVGQTIVIDYTVDLTAREEAAEAFRKSRGNMPGPQLMQAPDPPELDAEGMFWANVAPSGRVADGETGSADEGSVRSGAVYVPASDQYSFDETY